MHTQKEEHQCNDSFAYFNQKMQTIEYKPSSENTIIMTTIGKVKQMTKEKLKTFIEDLNLKNLIK